jgi:hypothetical protein
MDSGTQVAAHTVMPTAGEAKRAMRPRGTRAIMPVARMAPVSGEEGRPASSRQVSRFIWPAPTSPERLRRPAWQAARS